MTGYEMEYIHENEDGIVSKPLMVLNLYASDDEGAIEEAKALAERPAPATANAFVVLRGFEALHRGRLPPKPTSGSAHDLAETDVKPQPKSQETF